MFSWLPMGLFGNRFVNFLFDYELWKDDTVAYVLTCSEVE